MDWEKWLRGAAADFFWLIEKVGQGVVLIGFGFLAFEQALAAVAFLAVGVAMWWVV